MEKRLYLLPGMIVPPELASLVAGAINLRVISDHWLELLRLAMSIKTGTVTASVILRKLAAYPRRNGLAIALRELGKLERTFFTLLWLQDPELRRRSHVGLNKGEQQNALRRASGPFVATRLGAHQSNRRLPLGNIADPWARSISAAPDPYTRLRRSRLACLKFRIVSSPPVCQNAAPRFGSSEAIDDNAMEQWPH